MEVRVSASGYLQGGYWEPKQEGYGGRIRGTTSMCTITFVFQDTEPYTVGNLHDHVINFKLATILFLLWLHLIIFLQDRLGYCWPIQLSSRNHHSARRSGTTLVRR